MKTRETPWDIQAGGFTGTRWGDHQHRLVTRINQPGAFGCAHKHGRLCLMPLLYLLVYPLDFLRLHKVGVAVLAVSGFYIPDRQGLAVEQFNDCRGQYGQQKFANRQPPIHRYLQEQLEARQQGIANDQHQGHLLCTDRRGRYQSPHRSSCPATWLFHTHKSGYWL